MHAEQQNHFHNIEVLQSDPTPWMVQLHLIYKMVYVNRITENNEASELNILCLRCCLDSSTYAPSILWKEN